METRRVTVFLALALITLLALAGCREGTCELDTSAAAEVAGVQDTAKPDEDTATPTEDIMEEMMDDAVAEDVPMPEDVALDDAAEEMAAEDLGAEDMAGEGVMDVPVEDIATDVPLPANMIGPEGGTYETEDGVKIEIPAGALNEVLDFTIELASDPQPVTFNALGVAYNVTPDGLFFNPGFPAKLYLPVDAVPGSGELNIYWWDEMLEMKWIAIPATYDGTHLVAEILHLTVFQGGWEEEVVPTCEDAAPLVADCFTTGDVCLNGFPFLAGLTDYFQGKCDENSEDFFTVSQWECAGGEDTMKSYFEETVLAPQDGLFNGLCTDGQALAPEDCLAMFTKMEACPAPDGKTDPDMSVDQMKLFACGLGFSADQNEPMAPYTCALGVIEAEGDCDAFWLCFPAIPEDG